MSRRKTPRTVVQEAELERWHMIVSGIGFYDLVRMVPDFNDVQLGMLRRLTVEEINHRKTSKLVLANLSV